MGAAKLKRQFTATVYIFDEDNRVLLLHHRKFDKWMPPGGHLEPNETPAEAAQREVYEETGLEIEFITNENLWVDEGYARSFERPYLCLLEDIPAYGNEIEHQHIDFIYLAHPVKGTVKYNERESADIRWFTWEEIQLLHPGSEIFEDSLTVLKQIFGSIPTSVELTSV